MLIAYQAKIIGNQIYWQDTPPDDIDDVEILILPKAQKIKNSPKTKRQIPSILKGLGTQHGDIISNDEMIADWLKEHE